MSKDNTNAINFDDFNLENILDPNYVPEGLKTEPIPEPAPTPTPEPTKEPITVSNKSKKEPVPVEPQSLPDNVDPDKDADTPEIPDELDFKPFYQLFHEKLGWEVPENEQPENSIEGLIGYMDKIVTDNSKPTYSNPIVEQFDQFLANGGDPKKFYSTMFGPKDYSTVTLDTENDQKQVLREYLQKTNPDKPKEWVESKITRFNDSGVLEDEAKDALDDLRSSVEKEKSELVIKQQAQRKAQEDEQIANINELKKTILSKKDIAGIPIKESEGKEFLKYLLEPEKDGKTAYEKALLEDREAVIKMAFLAFKKFDVNNLKTNVKSEVVKDLKKSLSKFTSSTANLTSKTGIPQESNRLNYKDFDLNL